jgi:hypothetical protein
MSEVLVGSAYSTMELRYQQFSQGASVVEQTIQRLLALSKTPITVQAQLGGAGSGAGALTPPAARGGGAAPSVDADAAAYTRLQRAQAALEQQQARLARTQGDTARAAQLEAQAQERLTTELNAQNGTTTQSIAIERQLASVQQQSARAAQQEEAAQQQAMNAMRASVAPIQSVGTATQSATGYVDAFKSGLVSMVGPAAVAGLALGAVVGVANSFKEAFTFKAQLDATNTSIGIQLHGVRDSGQAFAEAAAFADRYRLTQEDTAAAIQASIPILRTSNASLSEVEATLLRLQVKKPEKSLADAARALDELKAGQIISIVDQFNVSRDAANKMKDEIAKGGDAVKVLSAYLTSAGIGMEALETRTKGAQGALNSLAVSQEKLKIAQASFAQGPGLALLQQQIKITDDATKAFGGSFIGLNNAIRDSVGVFNPAIGLLGEYNNAVLGGAQSVATFLGITGRTAAGSGPIAAFVAGIKGGVTSTNAFGGAVADVGNRLNPLTTTTAAAAAAIQHVTLNMDDERRAAGQLQAQIGQSISDMQRSAEASSVDAAQKALQAAQTKLVADQNRITTDSFLALNPNMGASGVIAAAAAQGYAKDIGILALLQLQLNTATDAQIALNNAQNLKGVAKTLTTERFAGRSGGRGDSSDAQADADAFVAGVKVQTAATEKTIDAQIALAAAHKDTAKQIDLLRQKANLFGKDEADRVQIQAQIISLQTSAGKTRVSAAQSTGLQLAQTEATSQAAILKAQREGQERLRDSEQDFLLHRSRSQEDEAIKIRDLLAHGQRAQAQKERETFAREQTRAQEDFTIQRQRTLRNNAESTGDIDARTDLRQQQIGQRAALRGVRPSGGAPVDLGAAPPTLTGAGGQAGGGRAFVLRVQVAPVSVQIDGHQIVELTWPETEQRIDAELARELSTIGIVLPPGGGQTAVAGGRP